MKNRVGSWLLSQTFQNSLLAAPTRSFIRLVSGLYSFSPQFLAAMQVTARPHYAYCLLGAADLARRLGIPRISALEFGVAGGNGLRYMCDFAADVTRTTGIEIECYGFDTGEGMPPPDGAKDLPYWFRESQYRMDQPLLRARLPQAKLVIGNVRDTVASFVADYNPAPIGFIVNDTDYWSSTADSLKLLDLADANPNAFLPRIFNYFDDIVGTALEMYGPNNGQLAAIEEFNMSHPNAKVHRNENLMAMTHLNWRSQIYYTHLFNHPRYNEYIGNDQQLDLEAALKLK
jgi:hypothetical protein